MEEAGYFVDSLVGFFPPLNDPIERHAHVVGKCRLDVRVNVDEVNGAWAGSGQDAKVIALWKQWIEGTQGFRIWIVAARNIRLDAEARFQRNRRDAVTGFRGDGPCLNIRRAEAAKLPKRFIVQVPPGLFVGNRAGKPRAQRSPALISLPPLKPPFSTPQPA